MEADVTFAPITNANDYSESEQPGIKIECTQNFQIKMIEIIALRMKNNFSPGIILLVQGYSHHKCLR